MRTYSVRFRYDDRKVGPEGRSIQVQASSIPVAISKATREFWSGLTRKQHFDASKGLKVEATLVVASMLTSHPMKHPHD